MNIKYLHYLYRMALKRTGNEAMAYALHLQKQSGRYAQELADQAINHAIDTM